MKFVNNPFKEPGECPGESCRVDPSFQEETTEDKGIVRTFTFFFKFKNFY